jgi:protein phosphatase methylesterase 1
VVWDATGNVDNDLSVENLSQDLVDMLLLTQTKLGWAQLPTIVLIGHSLGGAVVTHTANTMALGGKLLGYAVLDVVEGSAMEALKHMQTYLASRPKYFPSLPADAEESAVCEGECAEFVAAGDGWEVGVAYRIG